MKNNQNIKCGACGASSVVKNEDADLLECSYCGSLLSLSQPAGKQSKTTLSVIMISLPLIVVVLMVVFWAAFKNMRVHTSVEQYYPKDQKQAVQPKAIDPLAKPFLSNAAVEPVKIKVQKNAPKDDPVSWADKISITSQVKGETSKNGLFWIFGIENNSDQLVNRPGVVVSLFDENGKRLAEQSGWSALTEMKAGEHSEVLVFLSEAPGSIVKVEINTLASAPNKFSQPKALLKVTDFSVSKKHTLYDLIGDVKNPHDFIVKYSRIYAVARNQAGEPIGMGNVYATQKQLNAGEISGFKLRAGTFVNGQPDHWTLWAQGSK